jgi:prevent-host-death family protein
MESKVVTATEFKAKCLSLIKQMEQDGNSITITKRGQPVAVLGPAPTKRRKSLEGIFAKKIRIVGDIVNYSMWDPANK